jgi:hypothetical protein
MQRGRANGRAAMTGGAFLSVVSSTTKVRIFVSYDREHDADLLDRLVEDASAATSTFEISGHSAIRSPTDHWDEGLRRSIQEADQVVVICGEHTELSGRMAAELRIAREEDRPYVLLWGRREPMCKKPTTASPADTMYSWTPEILRNQILMHRRLSAGSRGGDGATT